MTLEALAALPVGSIVLMDDGEEGEIIRAGREVYIMWPQSNCTNIIDTKDKGWDSLVKYMEEVEAI
jgi:hypothetical protein